MEVDDDEEAFGLAPADDAVEQSEAVGVGRGEELPVDGDADGVEAGLFDEVDVGLRDVGVAPGMPEGGGALRAEHLRDELFDLALRLGAAFEVEHVPFVDHPVAEVDAVEVQGFACGVDDLGSLSVDELGWAGAYANSCQDNDQACYGLPPEHRRILAHHHFGDFG